MGKYTFQEFRDRISIIEIAEKLGYWWNKEKGGQKAHTYTLGDKKNPQDEIVIYNPNDSGTQSYFSRKGGFDDKGNLINFILNRLDRFAHDGTGFAAVNDILARYLGDNTQIGPQKQQQAPVASVVFNVKQYDIQPAKLNEFQFLTKVRKMSESTILDFIKIFAIYKVQHLSWNYYHCGFPFRIPGCLEITNFSLRNYNWTKHEGIKRFCTGGDKSNSCWIAAFTDKVHITDLYLFESEIDAMSYYELNGFTPKTTAAFVSLGGNVVRSQIENLHKEYPNVQFHFCYDNDVQGWIYDVTSSFWLQGINCKGYKEYPTGNLVFDFGNGDKEVLDKETFNSETYLHSKQIDCYPIHKPKFGKKDHNEELVYVKRVTS